MSSSGSGRPNWVNAEIESTLVALKSMPDAPECWYFVNSMICSIWGGAPFRQEDYEGGNLGWVLEIMEKTRTNFRFAKQNTDYLKDLTKYFLKRAYCHDVLFRNGTWLQKTIEFIADMLKLPGLKWVGSCIASFITEPFIEFYKEHEREIVSKQKVVNDGKIRATRLHSLREDLDRLVCERDSLEDICTTLFNMIKLSFNYKQPNWLISNQVVSILHEMKDCKLLFRNSQFYFNFFGHGLKSEHSGIVGAILQFIREQMGSASVLDEQKSAFLRYITEGECATMLYIHATRTNTRIIEKSLWILAEALESNLNIESWTPDQFHTVFLHVFHTSAKIRSLAAKCMFKCMNELSDRQKFERILELYIQYKSSPKDFPLLIDAIWSIEYMKHPRNLIEFYKNFNAESYGQEDLAWNAALSHCYVAVIQKLSEDKVRNHKLIYGFLKVFPWLIYVLRRSPPVVSILLGGFDFIDLTMFEAGAIGFTKHLDLLCLTFMYIFLKTDDQQCLHRVISVFVKFAEMESEQPRNELIVTVKVLCRKFKGVHATWASTANVGADIYDQLRQNSMKLSVLLSYPILIHMAEIKEMYSLLSDALFDQKLFDDKPERFRLVEIFYLDSLSSILLSEMMEIMDEPSIDVNRVSQVKTLVSSTSEKAQRLLIQSENSLFIRQNAMKLIVNTVIVVDPVFLFNVKQELRALAAPLDSKTYRSILETSVNILCEVERSDEKSQEYKRNILKYLIIMYKDYSGLPAGTLEWKYFSQLLLTCPFTKEVDNLLVAVALRKTPFDPKFRRLAMLLAAIFVKWGDDEIDTKAVSKRLLDLIQTNVKDWRRLFFMTTMRTVSNLARRISVIPAVRNRFLALNILKPFLFPDMRLKQQILEAVLPHLNRLRLDEQVTFADFRKYLGKH